MYEHLVVGRQAANIVNPWIVTRLTPPSAAGQYIMGKIDGKAKPVHIVAISAKMTPRFAELCGELLQSIISLNLTKEEAVQKRAELLAASKSM